MGFASLFFCSSSILLLGGLAVGYAAEDSQEELLIRRLRSSHLLANFRFLTKTTADIRRTNSFDIFPKLVGELAKKYELEEFELSLTQGLWRSRLWGLPPQPAAPTGAQVFAVFQPNASEIDEKWQNFVHALSGLFCASLAQIVPTLSVAPLHSLRPSGVLPPHKKEAVNTRYGVLASENVCTENLTPWKKLLPCREQGLAQLLNPLELYGSNYHSLSVGLRRSCPGSQLSCEEPVWELLQTLAVVTDAPLLTRKLNWRLRDVFNADLTRSCSLVGSSEIFVEIFDGKIPSFSPPPTELTESFARFQVGELVRSGGRSGLVVQFNASEAAAPMALPPPASPSPFLLHTFLAGTGQHFGKIISRITNNLESREKVVYSHLLPWYLRVFFHTIKVECLDGGDWRVSEPLFARYRPGKERARPHHFELGLELPAGGGVCEVSLEFQKSLLRWTEYPPDAHHGFHVPAPLLTLPRPPPLAAFPALLPPPGCPTFSSCVQRRGSRVVAGLRVYGEVTLVNLPTPDFSMPYNVICLVCTVVALAFGPVHNLTTRSLILKTEEQLKEEGFKATVRRRIAKIWDWIRGKLRSGKKEPEKTKTEGKKEN